MTVLVSNGWVTLPGQATEPSTLIPLIRGAECVVMAGDPKQLPPTVISQGALECGLDSTLFDRLNRAGARAQFHSLRRCSAFHFSRSVYTFSLVTFARFHLLSIVLRLFHRFFFCWWWFYCLDFAAVVSRIEFETSTALCGWGWSLILLQS